MLHGLAAFSDPGKHEQRVAFEGAASMLLPRLAERRRKLPVPCLEVVALYERSRVSNDAAPADEHSAVAQPTHAELEGVLVAGTQFVQLIVLPVLSRDVKSFSLQNTEKASAHLQEFVVVA